MKLISARVTNYKNIIDSGEFTLDDVTCLVGKNQSGKSTLLQALYRLNPVEAGLHQFNYESDYPKAQASEYNKGMDSDDRDHAVVVAGRFALDDVDLEEITSHLGKHCLIDESPEVLIRVDYSGKRKWSGPSIDEFRVLEHLTAISSISEEAKAFILSLRTFEDIRLFLEGPDISHTEEYDVSEIHEFHEQNREIIEIGVLSYTITEILETNVPGFIYYDSYSQMYDRIPLQEFIDKSNLDRLESNDLPMLGMLRLGGLEPQDLMDQSRSRERNVTELETAQAAITSAIARYWQVGPKFETKLEVVPFSEADDSRRAGQPALWVRVNDVRNHMQARDASTSLRSRSRGFQWMFSFACLLRFLEEEYDQLVVLLDEPGQSLHGDAQRELVKLIRSQSGSSKQFVYTTHSPFMIDPDRLADVRIVDGSHAETGAVVRDDIHSVGGDSLLPLQSALGYSVLTPLMIGPNVLLVEGVSDIVYLRAWQSLMLKEDRESLDDRWTIVPCGGIEKIPALLSFFYEREVLRLAVLCDGRPKSQGGISNSIRRNVIEKNQVVYLAEHLKKPDADIEDVLNPGTFVEIFNKTTGCELKVGDLPDGPPRILERLNGVVLDGDERIDSDAFHYKCSKTFEKYSDHFDKQMTDPEKDRIEGLFKVLNSLLPDEPKATSP